jgi:uncharacterized protein (DUF2235 family)
MPRNLVTCFDGTNYQFGADKTNVVRLRRWWTEIRHSSFTTTQALARCLSQEC